MRNWIGETPIYDQASGDQPLKIRVLPHRYGNLAVVTWPVTEAYSHS